MYKPREGQISWFFHRVSGLAIFFFLFGHILSTSVMLWGARGPEMHARLDEFYRLPIFTFLFHPALFAAVLYHALNGIRIVIIDWWKASTKAQRPLFYAEMALFVVLMVYAVFAMVIPEWKHYQESKAAVSQTAAVSVQEGAR